MSDDPVTTREMIAAYRDAVRPSASAKERMARALEAAVASRSATVIPLRPPPPRRRTAPIAWLALAAALLLVGASGYWLAGARHEPARGPADLLMAPQDAAPPQGKVTARPAEAPSAAAPVVQRAAQEPPTALEPTTPLEEVAPREAADELDPVLAELVLIQQIKDALDADRPGDALQAIDAHAQSFPRGSLAEEREALRVVALCEAGERARGERERQAFLRAYPRSAYRERVRTACPAATSTERSHFD